MAFQIAPRPLHTALPKQKPKKSKDYLAFLHKLPCCVTGQYGVEAAHLSFAHTRYGHYGRGKGTKAHDRWALPLSPEEHRKQHSMNEEVYWRECTDRYPHVLALTIWGLWSDMGDDAEPFATAIIMQGLPPLPLYRRNEGNAQS